MRSSSPESGLNAFKGTAMYMAPEVIHPGMSYGLKADVWSVGVVCYILLCGYQPFSGNTRNELFGHILDCDYALDESWDDISREAKDFIKRLLCVNPDKRLSCEEALVRIHRNSLCDARAQTFACTCAHHAMGVCFSISSMF